MASVFFGRYPPLSVCFFFGNGNALVSLIRSPLTISLFSTAYEMNPFPLLVGISFVLILNILPSAKDFISKILFFLSTSTIVNLSPLVPFCVVDSDSNTMPTL
uniref:Uncharacterized protein n=1 Tax=Yersinia enterocolitica TaxID=630 RepID=B0RKM5_YEREN|nr:hypothetical protein [Yersinia enterocolitica]